MLYGIRYIMFILSMLSLLNVHDILSFTFNKLTLYCLEYEFII